MSVESLSVPLSLHRAWGRVACGLLAMGFLGAEESVVTISPLNGATQIHVTSTAPGRVIPPNQNGQFRVNLTPVPLESPKTFYLQLDGREVFDGGFTLLWNADFNDDSLADVEVEYLDPEAEVWVSVDPLATPSGGYDYGWFNDYFRGVYRTHPDLLRVTVQPNVGHLDFAIRGESILYTGNYLAAKVSGISTGVAEGTVTGDEQALKFQLITDQVVVRNVVRGPNIRENDGTLNGGFIYGDNSATGRLWFGCEAWNPSQTVSSTAFATGQENRSATQAAIGQFRVLTQSLVQTADAVGAATSGQDFGTTLRFGAARYLGEGIAPFGPQVRDANDLVVNQRIRVSEYAYRRTTEWGPSRVRRATLTGTIPTGWVSLNLTLSTGDTVRLYDVPVTDRAVVDEVNVDASLSPAVMTFPAVVTGGLPRSWPVMPGAAVSFLNEAGVTIGTAVVTGTADPVPAPIDTYNPRNNGSTRTIAGNETRLNIPMVTVNTVTVPETAKNVKVFFPNIQGRDGSIYYNAPGLKVLNGGDFTGLMEITVSTNGPGRPYTTTAVGPDPLGNLNPTNLTLNWGSVSPVTVSGNAVIDGVTLTNVTDFTLDANKVVMSLTVAGKGKLNGGDPSRVYLEGRTVTFGSLNATIQRADLAVPNNDPLQYGTRGLRLNERVNIWYEEERNDSFYITGGRPTTPAAITVNGRTFYAVGGQNGTAPTTAQFSIADSEGGLLVTLNERVLIPTGSTVTIYPQRGGATNPSQFNPDLPDPRTVTGVPQVKLTTQINEPVLYGNPNGTGTYLVTVTGGNYTIQAGDQVRAFGADPDDPFGGERVWTCYGRSDEGAWLTDKRARMWGTAWEDPALFYVVLAGGPSATFYIPRAISDIHSQLKAHLAVPWTGGNVTVSIPGRITQSESFGGIYPVPDFGDPAQGSFQQGDYIEYLYKMANDGLVEGEERFSIVTRQDGENNGFEVMTPQVSSFVVWDNDSALSLTTATTLMLKTRTGTREILTSQNGSISFVLTRPLPQDVTIAYTVTTSAELEFKTDFDIPGAAVKDGVITGSVTIPRGETTKSVTVLPLVSTSIPPSAVSWITFVVKQSPSYVLSGAGSSSSALQVPLRYERTTAASIDPSSPGNGVLPGTPGGGLDGDRLGEKSSPDSSGCGAGSGLALLSLAVLCWSRRSLRRQKDLPC